MNSDRPTATERSDESNTARADRRRFLAIGAGIGATLLAGCSAGSGTAGSAGESPTDTSAEPATAEDTATVGGTFRLLISDQPVAIDEFESLDVTLDRARIFRHGGDGTATPTPTGTATAVGNATATPIATPAVPTIRRRPKPARSRRAASGYSSCTPQVVPSKSSGRWI